MATGVEVKIKPCLNGYIVEVGCQTVCFRQRNFLLKELKRYLKDPAGVSEEYMAKYDGGNREMVSVPHPEPVRQPDAPGWMQGPDRD